MVEPDHRSAEQQAGERPHRQVGLGTARALLWVLIPLQLGMVRVAERCRGYFGCVDRFARCASGGYFAQSPLREGRMSGRRVARHRLGGSFLLGGLAGAHAVEFEHRVPRLGLDEEVRQCPNQRVDAIR